MQFTLQPYVLAPWSLLNTSTTEQNLVDMEFETSRIRQEEGFEWVPVALCDKKERLFQNFMNNTSLASRLPSLFLASAEEASLSTCDRAHIGCVIADFKLAKLAAGHNSRPEYLDTPCDILGCEPQKLCRATYLAEQVAFEKLCKSLPGIHPFDLVLVTHAVPNLDAINLCERNGVSVIVFKVTRALAQKDLNVVSFKTIKSNMLFLKFLSWDDRRYA